jgi:hypothetical protein
MSCILANSTPDPIAGNSKELCIAKWSDGVEMMTIFQKRFSSCLRIVSVFMIATMVTLSLTACAQTPAANDDRAKSTVIKKTDIAEPNRGVTTYSDEELRRTGKPDAGTALKRRDPRIN